ncbi:MAG TPA: DUF1326 domain-containing protein [Pyrinomonadaceae bacterium]|nr:DUF1326 domain-containing protein [Pyrinomonadaceae bacterium]
MRRVVSSALMFLFVSCAAYAGEARAANYLKGDYVEARTASVFAGACHYNGEVTTTGRDAVLAWHVTDGRWNGTDMSGVRAIAVVASDTNLSETGAPRYEIVVDSSATEAQFRAFAEIVRDKFTALGRAVSLRRAPVAFRHGGGEFFFEAAGFARLNVRALPNADCCKMPHMVWYSPLVKLSGRRVGYTLAALYSGGALGDAWQRHGENSAFYGSFSL